MGDPYGLRRVVRPKGALPQQAEVLDPHLPLGPDELSIEVERLNVDAASFRQLSQEAGGDAQRISSRVADIVRQRGKMHNPVTGSGGMLIGRIAEVGPEHPAASELKPGDRVATLVSLTLTPLSLQEIERVHPRAERLDVRARQEGFYDLVVNCASLPGTEMASILAARDGGEVLFFNMATSFTAAALGAEGVGKDVRLTMGNGYARGHAELALELVRSTPALQRVFAARVG